MVSPFVSTFSHSGERVPLIHDANNNIKSDEEEAKNDDAKMKTTTFTTAFAFVAFYRRARSPFLPFGEKRFVWCVFARFVTVAIGEGNDHARHRMLPERFNLQLRFRANTWTGKVGAKLITSGVQRVSLRKSFRYDGSRSAVQRIRHGTERDVWVFLVPSWKFDDEIYVRYWRAS